MSLSSKEEQSRAMATLKGKSRDIGYLAEEREKKQPRLIIRNIPADTTNNCIKLITDQNPELAEMTEKGDHIRLVAVHDTKFDSFKNIILEVSPNLRKMMLQHKIKLGMCQYPVNDHIHVLRCTKCNRYGHPEKFCKADLYSCGVCAENHTALSSPSKNPSSENTTKKLCVNCRSTEHGADETTKCPSYHTRKTKLKLNINYE